MQTSKLEMLTLCNRGWHDCSCDGLPSVPIPDSDGDQRKTPYLIKQAVGGVQRSASVFRNICAQLPKYGHHVRYPTYLASVYWMSHTWITQIWAKHLPSQQLGSVRLRDISGVCHQVALRPNRGSQGSDHRGKADWRGKAHKPCSDAAQRHGICWRLLKLVYL